MQLTLIDNYLQKGTSNRVNALFLFSLGKTSDFYKMCSLSTLLYTHTWIPSGVSSHSFGREEIAASFQSIGTIL